jgi:conjugal transfer mating pair stabilization protein TraG
MVDLNHAMSHGEHRGDGVSQGVHTEQTRAIQKSVQMIEDFAKQNNISTQKSAEFLGAASVGGGILLKGSMGVSGAISSSDQDLLSKAQRFSESSDFQSSMREAAQASQNLSHTLNDDTSKRLSEGVSGSYERGNTLRDEASKSFRASQDYAKQAMETQASASSINANYNQEFLDWLSDQPSDHGPGSREGGGRIGKQGAAHIIANDPGGRMAYAQRFMEVKGLNPSPSIKMMAPSDLKESYNNETGHNLYPVISQDKDQIREKASLEFDPRSHEENKRFRQEVGETIKDRQGHIHKERKLQKQLLSPIDESINRESGKSVVGRVMKKAESEALQVGTEVVQGAKSLGKKVMKNLLGKTTKE